MNNREKLDGATFMCVMFGAMFGNLAIVAGFLFVAAGIQAVKYLCLND